MRFQVPSKTFRFKGAGSRNECGSEFQTVGPATEKESQKYCVLKQVKDQGHHAIQFSGIKELADAEKVVDSLNLVKTFGKARVTADAI